MDANAAPSAQPFSAKPVATETMQVASAVVDLIDTYNSDYTGSNIGLILDYDSTSNQTRATAWATNMNEMTHGNWFNCGGMDTRTTMAIDRAIGVWCAFYQKFAVYWECGGDLFKSLIKSNGIIDARHVKTFLDVCQVYEKTLFLLQSKDSTDETWREKRSAVYGKVEAILAELTQ